MNSFLARCTKLKNQHPEFVNYMKSKMNMEKEHKMENFIKLEMSLYSMEKKPLISN